MNPVSFLEWLRWQSGGPERPTVGLPPARLTVLTSSGRKALAPTKRARSGDTPGRRHTGDAGSHEHR